MIIQLQELINQVFRAVQITKNLDNLFTVHVMFGQNTTIKPLLCTHHITISQTLSPQELGRNLFLWQELPRLVLYSSSQRHGLRLDKSPYRPLPLFPLRGVRLKSLSVDVT